MPNQQRMEEPMNTDPSTTNQPPAAPEGSRLKLARIPSPWLVWPAAIGLAGLLFYGLDYLNLVLTHEATDDAFIEANVVSLAPRVAGQVAAVYVADNQLIQSNDLLIEIDPADYALHLAQKENTAETELANYKAVLAGFELMRTKVATAEAAARQAKADSEASEATAKRAAADFERSRELQKQNIISQQDYDAAQAAAREAEANLKAARQNVEQQDSKVEEARAQLSATEAAVSMVLSQWKGAQTNIASSRLDLSYTKIYAPCTGRVTRKSVVAGDYVQIGQMLMALVPTNVWVVANFKETELKHMRPGQPVKVRIDALAGRVFAAHVDSIQAGTGARFSLLPPENATGNYVKVVQRVPVKILFDEALPADHVIGPGLSVVPRVQVHSFALPDWVVGLVALVLAGTATIGFRAALRRHLAK
jgi:membrane fusion protein, multidrug efflux system